MKTLARWTPFREMAPFAEFPEMESFFADLPMRSMASRYEPMPTMRMDVVEGDAGYTLKAELPGMKKEDISVSIDGNCVSISAEAKREKDVKEGEKILRSERYVGTMSRAFTLPMDVDVGKAEAKFADGVLKLTLPKTTGTPAHRLSIN